MEGENRLKDGAGSGLRLQQMSAQEERARTLPVNPDSKTLPELDTPPPTAAAAETEAMPTAMEADRGEAEAESMQDGVEAHKRAEAEARIESGEAGRVEIAAVQESSEPHPLLQHGYEGDEDTPEPLKKRAKVVKIEDNGQSEAQGGMMQEAGEQHLVKPHDQPSPTGELSSGDTPTPALSNKKKASSSRAPSKKVALPSKKAKSSSKKKSSDQGSKKKKVKRDEAEDAAVAVDADASTTVVDEMQSSYEPESEGDEKLYCICQTLYDEDRMMIACDRCDEWFHTSCMKMKDSDVELVDMFMCPNCAKETGQQTTWKTKCLRQGCNHGAMPPLSRYCSERCGILVAASRIAKTKYAKLSPAACVERLMTARVRASKRTEGIAVWTSEGESNGKSQKVEGEDEAAKAEMMQAVMGEENHDLVSLSLAPQEQEKEQERFAIFAYASPDAEELYRSQQESRNLNEARDAINRSLDLLAARNKVLQLAEDRIGTLEPLIDDSLASTAPSSSKKKSKKKGGGTKATQEEEETASEPATARVVARCGFDERISWDDARFDGWCRSDSGRKMLDEEVGLDGHLDPPTSPESEGEAVREESAKVCSLAKKKCKRHADWNVLKSAEFEVQRELQTRTLSALSEQTQDVESRISQLKNAVESWARAKRANEALERHGRDEALAKELSRLESRRPILHANGR